MKKLSFPLLKGKDAPEIPSDLLCPICGVSVRPGFAYITMASSVDYSLIVDPKCELALFATCNIGFHSPRRDGVGSANVPLVEDLIGGQFAIHFCSVDCLECFFGLVLKELRDSISRDPDSDEPIPKDLADLLDNSEPE